MPNGWDADIAAMQLSDIEKNGLQVYRNYANSFEKHRASEFLKKSVIDAKVIADLDAVTNLLATEQARFLPVIACAFADDQLKEMFRREIAESVPGGRKELLSGFGPLSNLSQRIQMAYAFGWLSPDLLIELDLLRKIRNEVSHKWDVKLLESRLSDLIENRQEKIEECLEESWGMPPEFHLGLSPVQKLQFRTIWVLGRVTYECQLWVPALKQGLKPGIVLYKHPENPLLVPIGEVCGKASRLAFGNH